MTAGRRVLGLTIPPMKQFGPMLIVWGAAMATLLITRELGTSLMFFGAFLALLYVATGRFSFPLIGLVLFALGVWYVTGHVSHVHARVRSLGTPVQPDALQQAGRRQLPARAVAVRAGRRRLPRHRLRPLAAPVPGRTRQPHTSCTASSCPVPESDMIYAVIVNELGLLGGAALLLVFLLLVARGLKIAVLARDSFSKLLATGLSFVIALQVFVIVGGVTRVIPLTGVTLPFVAYGGSSVVMNFVLVALLLVISDRARRPTGRSAPRRRRPVGRRGARQRRRTGPAADAELDHADRRRDLAARAAHRGAQGRTAARPASPRTAAVGHSPAGLHGGPWPARLRRALAHERFELHYQPIVALRDGRVSHYEALLRLADDPAGALLAPGAFLPAAERYGLIREIDRMVLARVARLLGPRSGDGGDVTIAINVSALSVTDPSDARASSPRTLARHEVDPERLAIEITETAAISDMERARAFCARRPRPRAAGSRSTTSAPASAPSSTSSSCPSAT